MFAPPVPVPADAAPLTAVLARLGQGRVIASSTFGSPTDPAVLLIGGTGASMDWWTPEFCERLAAGGRYVIRYDHRDTGESPSYPPGAPGYTGADLVADAVSVLDALGVPAAHVVGISMGGGIAQQLVVGPSGAGAVAGAAVDDGRGGRSGPARHVAGGGGGVRALAEPDWTDDAAVVEYLVAEPATDRRRNRTTTRRSARSPASRSPARRTTESSQKNHYSAEGGRQLVARTDYAEITVPTLVLHGDSDPLSQLPHGEALAREIPNARLVVLPNTGHEFPSRNWPQVLAELQ